MPGPQSSPKPRRHRLVEHGIEERLHAGDLHAEGLAGRRLARMRGEIKGDSETPPRRERAVDISMKVVCADHDACRISRSDGVSETPLTTSVSASEFPRNTPRGRALPLEETVVEGEHDAGTPCLSRVAAQRAIVERCERR